MIFSQPLRSFDFYGTEPVYNTSTIEATSSLTADGIKISFASCSISSPSSVSASGVEVLDGSVTIEPISFTVATGSTIKVGSSDLFVVSNFRINGTVRFSSNITEDTQSIRTLLTIDGHQLSEHGRSLNQSINHIYTENINWSSRSSRYYRRSSGRKIFSIEWQMLPGYEQETVDGRHGRNKIAQIAKDPKTHVLKIKNIDSSDTTPYTEDEYTVLVKQYTESLVRRDISSGIYLWTCSIELEEV